MNIVTTKVEYPYITFISEHGNGIGYISDQQPAFGKTYSVEFDFLPSLNINQNAIIGTTKDAGFYIEDDCTIIVALVESIDEDDDICLRIGQDCIIIAYNEDHLIQPGDKIEIRTSKDEFIITCIGW